MDGTIFVWVFAILIFIIIFVLRVRCCWQRLEAYDATGRSNRTRTRTTNIRPYTISNNTIAQQRQCRVNMAPSPPSAPNVSDIEIIFNSTSLNPPSSHKQEDKDLPTYDEVISQTSKYPRTPASSP